LSIESNNIVELISKTKINKSRQNAIEAIDNFDAGISLYKRESNFGLATGQQLSHEKAVSESQKESQKAASE